MKVIAYLAPEIPALSATFVYNEIIALQCSGYTVVPISVHKPGHVAKGDGIDTLAQQTLLLYPMGLASFLAAALQLFFSKPKKFLQVLFTVVQDASTAGLAPRVRTGLFYRFLAACRVAHIVKERRCRHLHAHFAHVPTEIAMYAALLSEVPYSFTSHANDLFVQGRLLGEKVARARFAVTISHYNRNLLLAEGGEPSKIHVIRCGVDRSKFSSRPLVQAKVRTVIGSVGRMVEKKGFDTLLQAADLLKKKNFDFQLTVVGDGPLKNRLHALVGQLDLDGYVDLPGAMDNANLSAWLQTLDLFVLPCRRDANGDMDGIPVVLMEAMLSGIPVISTEISGIPELIRHEREGLLVQPADPEQLAQAIQRGLQVTSLREGLRKSALKRVISEFSVDLNVSRLVNLLQKKDAGSQE